MDGFEEIYKMYFGDVYRYILALCVDEHTAEEITSDTFFKAIRSIDSFRGECDVRVWLCRIAKNCWLDRIKKQKRELPLEDNRVFEQTEPFESALEKREIAATLHRALHCMPEPYKEVFSLRVFGELGFEEIGALFDKNAHWACVTYHRAKAKIAKSITDKKGD